VIQAQLHPAACPQCGARFAAPIRWWMRPTRRSLLYCPQCDAKIGGPPIRDLSDPELHNLLDRAGKGNKGKIANALRREILRRARRRERKRQQEIVRDDAANTAGKPFVPPLALPWICPSCANEIGPSEMSRDAAQERLAAHMQANHNVVWSETREATDDGLPARDALHELGAEETKPPETSAILQKVPTGHFPFKLLPPGKWRIEQVIPHYRRLSHSQAGFLQGRKLDVSRIERIWSLGATKPWIGEDAWHGYIVFEFPNTDRVVLECPFEGNATYVLWGNWKERLSWTKTEIRAEQPNRHLWFPHRGNWLNRVRAALRLRQRQGIVYVKPLKPSGSRPG
jgi:hypothetical protein